MFFRAVLDQERHRVLETDSKGNLYLYKSALLCKSEIIKRLTEDNFRVVKPSATEGKVHTEFSVNIMANLKASFRNTQAIPGHNPP